VTAEVFTAVVALALLLASIVGLAGVIGGIIELEHSRDDLAELRLSRR
jgi:hypothetical protein